MIRSDLEISRVAQSVGLPAVTMVADSLVYHRVVYFEGYPEGIGLSEDAFSDADTLADRFARLLELGL